MIIILFGKPCVGKNFVGEILNEQFKFYFYDADDDLTEESKKSINKGILMTDKMRDKYFQRVIRKIQKLKEKHENIVVSQAFIKQKHRNMIHQYFPESIFILVYAKDELRNLRFQKRSNHIIKKEFSEKIDKIFEEPQMKHFTIDNNIDKEHIILQIEKILQTIKLN